MSIALRGTYASVLAKYEIPRHSFREGVMTQIQKLSLEKRHLMERGDQILRQLKPYRIRLGELMSENACIEKSIDSISSLLMYVGCIMKAFISATSLTETKRLNTLLIDAIREKILLGVADYTVRIKVSGQIQDDIDILNDMIGGSGNVIVLEM